MPTRAKSFFHSSASRCTALARRFWAWLRTPDEPNRVIARWTVIIAVVTALGAASTALQWYELNQSSKQTERAIEAATRLADATERTSVGQLRAWISPRRATFATEPLPDQLLIISVAFDNVGREPALNMVHAGIGGTVAVPKNSHGQVYFGNQSWPPNGTCDLTAEGNGSIAVYPSTSNSQYTIAVPAFTGPGVPRAFFEPVDLAERSHTTLYFQGCFRYETFGQVHKSKYCYVIYPEAQKPPSQWQLRFCPEGNEAD